MRRGFARALVAGVLLLAACSRGGDAAAPGPSGSSPSPGTTDSPCFFTGAEAEQQGTFAGGHDFLLTDVRTGAHGCFERVVFEMRPSSGTGGAPGYGVRYENGPFTSDPSDEPLPVQGSAFIVVRLDPVQSVDQAKPGFPATYTGPRTLDPPELTHVQQIRNSGDFEGVIGWIVGLDIKRPFTVNVITEPGLVRFVVDIG